MHQCVLMHFRQIDYFNLTPQTRRHADTHTHTYTHTNVFFNEYFKFNLESFITYVLTFLDNLHNVQYKYISLYKNIYLNMLSYDIIKSLLNNIIHFEQCTLTYRKNCSHLKNVVLTFRLFYSKWYKSVNERRLFYKTFLY